MVRHDGEMTSGWLTPRQPSPVGEHRTGSAGTVTHPLLSVPMHGETDARFTADRPATALDGIHYAAR